MCLISYINERYKYSYMTTSDFLRLKHFNHYLSFCQIILLANIHQSCNILDKVIHYVIILHASFVKSKKALKNRNFIIL